MQTWPKALVVLLGCLPLILLAGCREEEQVVRYTAPKPPTYAAPEIKERLLGALFPQGNRTWGFKVNGPAGLIKEHEETIERFFQSVRLSDEAATPISWKLPDGWQEQRNPNDPVRYAAITFGTKDHPLRLTVSLVGKLDDEGRALLLNVNRWRGMVGLKPAVAPAEAMKNARIEKIDGVPTILVDLSGPGGTPRKGMGR